jgi:predicted nucleic acid-binding protein
MILIDTGFLLALAQPSDSLHERAVHCAAQISDSLVVTEYVLCETVNSLSKRADRQRGHRILHVIQNNARYSIIAASPDLFTAGLKLHKTRMDKDWSLTDCISFHVMNERGITQALAFDEHFEQAGFVALLRIAP